jgi:hypothetical protein
LTPVGGTRLVKAKADIPLTKEWGGGEVASADGLRFVVPVRTLHAGYNSKYFHVERGESPVTGKGERNGIVKVTRRTA